MTIEFVREDHVAIITIARPAADRCLTEIASSEFSMPRNASLSFRER